MQLGTRLRRPAAALAIALAAGAASPAALAEGAFSGFGGSWTGTGQFRLESGQREAIRCSASYVPRGGGTSLGLSLRCASASGRVELRASLSASGSRVSGTWEERSYGVSGDISGAASGSSMRLSFSGGLSGVMMVTTSGSSQSISVRTDASVLKSVSVSLHRN